MKTEKYSQNIIAVNISWNPYQWRKIYIDPRAGHSYARKYPGHESLNFKFDKKIDLNGYVYGFVQWRFPPKSFIANGTIIFYTKNLDENKTEIVGIYGRAALVDPIRSIHYSGFQNDTLNCNIKAIEKYSFLFPIPLSAKKYIKGRMVGQIGFTYYDNNFVNRILEDEYSLLRKSGNLLYNEIKKINDLYYAINGKNIDGIIQTDIFGDDAKQQNEIEVILRTSDRNELAKELNDLIASDPEIIEIRNRQYKRDNKTIVQIKYLREFKCQICGANIIKKDGSMYIEAAHIKPKKDKGNELPNNIIILCPNHHKEFDLGEKEINIHTKEQLEFVLNKKKYVIDLVLK
jgi:hypothetical protein